LVSLDKNSKIEVEVAPEVAIHEKELPEEKLIEKPEEPELIDLEKLLDAEGLGYLYGASFETLFNIELPEVRVRKQGELLSKSIYAQRFFMKLIKVLKIDPFLLAFIIGAIGDYKITKKKGKHEVSKEGTAKTAP